MDTPHDKVDLETVESLGPAQTQHTYIAHDEIASLSQSHKDYLIAKHGSLDLDPVPSFGDADPYNWANWKVIMSICAFVPALIHAETG